jgi:hypothetical protein
VGASYGAGTLAGRLNPILLGQPNDTVPKQPSTSVAGGSHGLGAAAEEERGRFEPVEKLRRGVEDRASWTQLIQELLAEGSYAVTRYRFGWSSAKTCWANEAKSARSSPA